MSTLWFEDLQAGFRFTTPGATLTEAQIVEFAFQFDPQPFHMNAHAAQQSHFGGVIASGLHSLAVACRLIQQSKPWAAAAMGSPGIEELRWLQPVRPGDTLHVETEVRAVRPSASRPDRGIVLLHHEVYNQAGTLVLTYTLNELVARKGANGTARKGA